ncbi:MAG TPA: phospholipase D family protein [Rhodocyclaceae bacterium]|nr:phospholipase D family protein [Rhodocyclaceae bacterium]
MRKFLGLFALCCLSLCSVAHATALPAMGEIEALFSPWDDVEGHLIGAIDQAQHNIHVQAYLLTSRNIADALLRARERGVHVEVLADAAMVRNGESSRIPMLAAAGIPVWLETRYANAHNKIMLIDVEGLHPVVITGSYNYTWSAQARNAENILILRDNPALATRYLNNWQRHRHDAETYAVSDGK